MGNYALLLLSLAVALANTMARNAFSKNYASSAQEYHCFNAASNLISMIVLAVIAVAAGRLMIPSFFTVGLALLYGTLTAVAAWLSLRALKLGSMSYTTVIGASSMIIPALSGMIFWKESVSVSQISGVILMLVSLNFAVGRSQEKSKMTAEWMICCLGSALLSGGIGVLQKIHQSSVYADELNMFLSLSFLISFIVSVVQVFATRQTGDVCCKRSIHVTAWIILCVTGGICVALANQINLYLAGAMDSMIFFPVVNGGGLLLTVGTGVIFLKERFSSRQTVGMVLGIVSVLLLCGIF